MDISDNAMKEAAKLMSGKSKRSSGEQVQITLAQQVMMDYLKDKPKLLESRNKEVQIIRKNPPSKDEFVDWIRTIDKKEMVDKTEIKKTTIDHWYRRDDAGFSLPSISDWCLIEANFDVPGEISYKMNDLIELDWQRESDLLPTPRANDIYHPRTQGKGFTHRKERGYCAEVVIDKYLKGMLPTPASQNYKGASSKEALEKRGRLKDKADNLADQFAQSSKSIQLNPLFVMEMMGFPINWTLMPFLKDRPEVHEGLFYDEGWDNFPISNPLCPKFNKDDFEDITTSKWKNESIKAGGNAIVPQVALQIFKVIQKIEND